MFEMKKIKEKNIIVYEDEVYYEIPASLGIKTSTYFISKKVIYIQSPFEQIIAQMYYSVKVAIV